LRAQLRTLHDRLCAGPVRGLLRRDFLQPPTAVVVVAGDVLAHDDAHLVVGFTDTFDTAVAGDVVISGASLQGQLLARIYGGDRALLDRALRQALRGIPPTCTETRAAKRHGKLARYPVGTVAALPHSGRRIFAVAYSRMGNDLIARSSLADLRTSLDRLWESAYRHGQRRPVAVPLICGGLARIDSTSHADLLKVIIESFVAHARVQVVTRELRVVLQPGDLTMIDLNDLQAFVQAL
jgi:hypothetical protein